MDVVNKMLIMVKKTLIIVKKMLIMVKKIFIMVNVTSDRIVDSLQAVGRRSEGSRKDGY